MTYQLPFAAEPARLTYQKHRHLCHRCGRVDFAPVRELLAKRLGPAIAGNFAK